MTRDLDSLQGTWTIVSMEIEGQAMGGGGAQIAVQGSRFTTSAMGAAYSGTLTVDETASPKSFDLHFEEGPEKGSSSLGIYELNGDVWKICLTTRGSVRPKEFIAPAGTGIALETLHRSSAAEAETVEPESSSAADTAGESADELSGEWQAISLVRDGDALPASMLSHGKRTATGNEVTVKFGGQVILKARYSVDRSRTPMTMDYELAGGKRQQGIWKLEDGKLSTCFGAPGVARPSEFASTKGDGRTLAVWSQKSK